MSEADTYALLRLHDELDELEAAFGFKGLRKKVPIVALSVFVGWAFWVLTPPHYHMGAAVVLAPYAALLIAGPIYKLVRIRRLRGELATIEERSEEESEEVAMGS